MMNATTATDFPNDRDAALADQADPLLAEWSDGSDPIPGRFGIAISQSVDIPTSGVRLLEKMLDHLAHGNGVALMPLHGELTTRQAADLLQVSRTHLVQLLDERQNSLPKGRRASRHSGQRHS